MDTAVTCTAVLDVRENTLSFLARLLMPRRIELGTRKGRRALGRYRQAALVIRWFLDGTRVALLTDRCSHPGPNGADLRRSGKHKHHGGNVQALSDPTGWPIWVSGVRPGREHDTTCAKAAAGLMPALEQAASEDMPTLTDLGYEGLAGPALRMPAKKTKGVELSEPHKQYNLIVRGVHSVAERANSLLKTTFKALRRVSVCPWRIGAIAKAALVLLHLEHDRPLPARHRT
jgi:hypothetical protein